MFLIKRLYHHTKPDPGCRSDRSHCSDDHLKEKQYRKRPAMMKMGWFTGLNEKLAAIDPTLLSVWGRGNVYEGGYGVIAGAVGIYLIGYMGLPHSVNKHMAMGSPQTAKTSVVYATIWTQLFCFIPYFLGLAGL